MKYIILIFFITFLEIFKIECATLKPISLESCEGAERSTFLDLRKVNGKSEKAWFGNVTIPFVIDPNVEFVAELHKWKNGEWDKKAQTFKGKACFYLQKFGAKLWKQIREATKPQIVSACPIPNGVYTVDNFSPDYSGAFLPMLDKHKYQAKITLAKNGKLFCILLTAEIV